MSVETTTMLLYAVAAIRVEPTGEAGWFNRCADAHAAIISISEDVLDIVLRLPHVVPRLAKLKKRAIREIRTLNSTCA